MANTTPTTNSLENYFLPFTANKDFKKDPRLLDRGEGVYYWNHKGDQVIDASSGLFCVPLGHGRKEIAEAVHQQLLKLDYSPSFQVSHLPAFALAEKVANLLPGDLNNVFFTICGSTAIDSAIKIIQAYQHAIGQSQRVRFVSRERAYHGVNIGGTSLSGMIKNREIFTATMPGVIHLRHTWLEENKYTKGQPQHGAHLAEDLQRFVEMYGPESIAGCFVEPIAGSTGTIVPPIGYLERLREICDKYGIVLVFDEVITGFGRTGKSFGAVKYNVQPDMITMAKAITNGAQPMGAVGVSDKIYNAIVDNGPEHGVEFFHGYTYSGHPVACAVAFKTLEIYERDNMLEHVNKVSPTFTERLKKCDQYDLVGHTRGIGLIGAMEFVSEKNSNKGFEKKGVAGKIFADHAKDNGLIVRAIGDVIAFCPPLIITDSQINDMFDIVEESLKKTMDELTKQGLLK